MDEISESGMQAQNVSAECATASELHVQTMDGTVFVKSWSIAGCESKSPLILFHESLGCVDLWRDFPSRLASASARRVIAYDRIGFGRSTAYPGTIDQRFMQRESINVLPSLFKALDVADFIACGHSVGGGIAAVAAATFPAHCRALITISAHSFVEQITRDGIRVALRNLRENENFSRLAKYHGDKTDWALEAWTGTWLSAEYAHWSLDDTLDAIHCPVLAVHGDRDEYGTVAQAQRIARGRGSVQVLDGIGHLPHRECPDRLVAIIERFLRDNGLQD